MADLCEVCAAFMFPWRSLASCPLLYFLLFICFLKHFIPLASSKSYILIGINLFWKYAFLKVKAKYQGSIEMPSDFLLYLKSTCQDNFLSPYGLSSAPIFPVIVTWIALLPKHESLKYTILPIYLSNLIRITNIFCFLNSFSIFSHLFCRFCLSLVIRPFFIK